MSNAAGSDRAEIKLSSAVRSDNAGERPRLLYIVTEDWFFATHFLPMVRAARAAGFEVSVATRVRDHAEQIVREGCRIIPFESERKHVGPFEIAGSVARIIRIVRAERPDVVHCIALRMVVIGGLAARLAGVDTLVLAPTGLGHLWLANGAIERAGRRVVRFVIGRLLRGPGTYYLFENLDDPAELGIDPAGPDVTRVGAGVDPATFPPTSEPAAPPIKVAIVARMLAQKGIREAVEATRRARALGAPIELHLFGAPDPGNPSSLTQEQLREWSREEGIAWHGPTGDVAKVWREHHIALLLTYREGGARTLVEAAAGGRPIVATDVTGCRAVVRNGIEGFLVLPREAEGAARALVQLAKDPELRARMGRAARQRFLENFTEEVLERTLRGLYFAIREKQRCARVSMT
jgi:glycosyltransferase involved in cell wall biosynthesis